jgi:hypothetical protein
MTKLFSSRLSKLSAVVALLAFALPATAFGQATRTWVSGVGDDVNPCSRTAPCKTFAGAISKTAAGGIIDTLDPGGFGSVTITKSLTIDGHNTLAGVLASGGINAINVNAAATDKITLRGLDIEGNGTTLGLNGVNIIGAKVVRIEDSQIAFFSRDGVHFVPNTPNARLVVQNTTINGNGGNAVFGAPTSTAGGSSAKATLRNVKANDNACGVTASSTGFDSATLASLSCGAAAAGAGSRITITSFDSIFSDSAFVGVLAKGSTATERIGRCEIVANSVGVLATDAGAAVQAFTGTNLIADNSTNGTPTSFIAPV